MIQLLETFDYHTPMVQMLLAGKGKGISDSVVATMDHYQYLGKARYVCSKHGEFFQERKISMLTGEELPPTCLECEREKAQLEVCESVKLLKKRELDEAMAKARKAIGEGAKFEKCSFEDFQTFGDSFRIKALTDAHRLVQRKLTFLVLLANNGTGKTTLASAIGNSFVDSGKKAVYCKEAQLMRSFRSTFRSDDITESALYSTLADCDFLCIDEIAKSGLTEYGLSTMQDLIDDRYRSKRQTVLVSNLVPDQFFNRLGESVRSRIFEDGAVDTIVGEDLRKRGKCHYEHMQVGKTESCEKWEEA